MFKLRGIFYSGVLLCVTLLPLVGCGKPAPPPEGAKDEVSAPSIDLGTAPQDTGTPATGGAAEPANPK